MPGVVIARFGCRIGFLPCAGVIEPLKGEDCIASAKRRDHQNGGLEVAVIFCDRVNDEFLGRWCPPGARVPQAGVRQSNSPSAFCRHEGETP